MSTGDWHGQDETITPLDKLTELREMRTLLLGERLGSGIARSAYVYGPDEKKVIKWESAAYTWQNISEWLVWKFFADIKPWGQWLAPCHSITHNGTFLIQMRVAPIRRSELPKKVPSFLGDLKQSNWGMYKGRPVACDYGSIVNTFRILRPKLETARWFDHDEMSSK